MKKNFNTSGFTLIELLVVVLIIGILAAVALPQYQKAVEKSRVTQATTLLKSVYQAALAYQLEHGEWPTQFEQLSISIPWTGNTPWNTYTTEVRDTLSNEEWSLQLINSSNVRGVEIGRLSGNYTGGGFGMYEYHAYWTVPRNERVCLEKNNHGVAFTGTKGDYCTKIFGGEKVYGEGAAYSYIYSLPK